MKKQQQRKIYLTSQSNHPNKNGRFHEASFFTEKHNNLDTPYYTDEECIVSTDTRWLKSSELRKPKKSRISCIYFWSYSDSYYTKRKKPSRSWKDQTKNRYQWEKRIKEQ